MGQKLTSHLQDIVAAVPLKLAAATTALGLGGAAADATTRAPLLSELVFFHIAGHSVTLPVLAMLLAAATGFLTLIKMLAALLGGAARRIRRKEGAP